MDIHTTLSAVAQVAGLRLMRRDTLPAAAPHIIDELIAERTTHLSRNPLWPIARPLLYRWMHYRQAITIADEIIPLSGWDSLEHVSRFLSLNIAATGMENIPRSGGFILAPTHPTGIADGIAMFDLLKVVRDDTMIFANRDTLRINPRFREVIIPVEWRAAEKSHAKSRDTLEMTARSFMDKKAIVLFPAGRIAFWNEGKLTERPWQTSLVALARRYQVPIVPVHITARNSGLFYLMSRYSDELRDMTLFHELLNKRQFAYQVTVGRQIMPDAIEGDIGEVTARLQDHAVETLARDGSAIFKAPPLPAETAGPIATPRAGPATAA